MKCRLCSSGNTEHLHRDRDGNRSFHRCTACGLIFVPEREFLTPEQEAQRYARHRNTLQDEEYVRYCAGVADEVERLARPAVAILDFGCGQHRVLSFVLNKRGFVCDSYDPLYGIGMETRGKRYSTIVLCEVIEHVRDLPAAIRLLRDYCAPQASVYIRTLFVPDTGDCAQWWYMKDPTHINFFSWKAVEYLAAVLNMSITFSNNKNVVMLSM